MDCLFIHPLRVFTSKGEEVELPAAEMVNLGDFQNRDYVSYKFKHEGKSHWVFRDDLLMAMHGDHGVPIVSSVAFPGFMIYDFKKHRTVRVLRVKEDEIILEDMTTLNLHSLDYGVVNHASIYLPEDRQLVLRNGVHAFHSATLVTEDKLDWLEEHLSSFDTLAFDSETTGLSQDMYKLEDREDFVVSISVSTDANSGFYIKASKTQRFREFIEFLCTKHLVMHNASFDVGMLSGVYGLEPATFDDTLVIAKLLNENLMTYRLKDLASQVLGRGKQLKLAEFDYLGYLERGQFDKIEYILAYYACADTANTYGLYQYSQPKLQTTPDLWDYYRDVEIASIVPVAIAISQNGLTVDTEALTALGVEANQYQLEQLEIMRTVAQPFIDAINAEYIAEQEASKQAYWDELLVDFTLRNIFTNPVEIELTKELVFSAQYNCLPNISTAKKLGTYHSRLLKRAESGQVGNIEYTLDLSNKKFLELLVYTSAHGFGLPPQKSKAGGYSFNKAAISEIEKFLHTKVMSGSIKHQQIQAFFTAFREYTKTRKLIDAFITPTLSGIGTFQDGKLHASYNLLGTVSSRASCSNPNFQQLANNKRFDLRKCFVVEDKSKYSFLQFDLTSGQLKLCELLETLTIQLQAISSLDLECETLVL